MPSLSFTISSVFREGTETLPYKLAIPIDISYAKTKIYGNSH